MLLNFTLMQADTLKTATLGDKLSTISSINSGELLSSLSEMALSLATKLVVAIIIYYVGSWLIRKIKKITSIVMDKKDVELSLRSFTLSFISIALKIFLIVIIIGVLGINTASFAALIAAGGLAVGMALSGTLQNFAGGVMILLFKPFKVGDFIEAQGYMGTVKEIKITSTFMTTPDNKMIIIPNGPLSNGIVNNFSQTGVRRVEWKVSLPYGHDLQAAKELIINMLNKDSRVLQEPAAPFATIDQMADSAVVIVARAWVKTEDFWGLFFDINESIYTKYPENGFEFPFPQLDINLKKD